MSTSDPKAPGARATAPAADLAAPAGADLAALAHTELDSSAKKAADAAGAVPDGMPAFAQTPEWQPPPMTVTFWQKLAPRSRRGLKPVHLVLGVVGASALTGGLVVGALALFHQSTPPPAPTPVVATAAPAGTPTPTAPAAAQPATQPAATPATTAPTATAVETPAPAAPVAAAARPAESKGKTRPRAEPVRAASASPASAEPEPAAPPAAPAADPAPEAGRALTAADIKAGVKKGMSPVMECIKTARKAGELAPGTYTLNLDWTIAPSGEVTAARVSGPAGVLNTSIPGCFSQGMRQWQFPASPAGAPVKNFPFGPFTIK